MSGWDWIDAGLSVLILNKANKAQKNLQAMQTSAEMAAYEKQMLSEMRDYIFSISREIQMIEKEVGNSPQQSYIVSKAIDRRLKESGLSVDLFPEIQDKEYFFKTESLISDVISKSKSQIDEEQEKDGDKAVDYIFDLFYLKPAILSDEARTYLQETEKNWNELNKIHTRNSTFRTIGFIGLAVSSLTTCILGTISMTLLLSGELLTIIIGLILALIIIVFWVGSILLVVFGSKKHPGWQELKAARDHKRMDLLSREQQLEFNNKFGNVTGKAIQDLYDERIDFIEKQLGEEFEKFLN